MFSLESRQTSTTSHTLLDPSQMSSVLWTGLKPWRRWIWFLSLFPSSYLTTHRAVFLMDVPSTFHLFLFLSISRNVSWNWKGYLWLEGCTSARGWRWMSLGVSFTDFHPFPNIVTLLSLCLPSLNGSPYCLNTVEGGYGSSCSVGLWVYAIRAGQLPAELYPNRFANTNHNS